MWRVNHTFTILFLHRHWVMKHFKHWTIREAINFTRTRIRMILIVRRLTSLDLLWCISKRGHTTLGMKHLAVVQSVFLLLFDDPSSHRRVQILLIVTVLPYILGWLSFERWTFKAFWASRDMVIIILHSMLDEAF